MVSETLTGSNIRQAYTTSKYGRRAAGEARWFLSGAAEPYAAEHGAHVEKVLLRRPRPERGYGSGDGQCRTAEADTDDRRDGESRQPAGDAHRLRQRARHHGRADRRRAA